MTTLCPFGAMCMDVNASESRVVQVVKVIWRLMQYSRYVGKFNSI